MGRILSDRQRILESPTIKITTQLPEAVIATALAIFLRFTSLSDTTSASYHLPAGVVHESYELLFLGSLFLKKKSKSKKRLGHREATHLEDEFLGFLHRGLQ